MEFKFPEEMKGFMAYNPDDKTVLLLDENINGKHLRLKGIEKQFLNRLLELSNWTKLKVMLKEMIEEHGMVEVCRHIKILKNEKKIYYLKVNTTEWIKMTSEGKYTIDNEYISMYE